MMFNSVLDVVDELYEVGDEWYADKIGAIRCRSRSDPSGEPCCPIAAIFGCENEMAYEHASQHDRMTPQLARSIISAADNHTQSPNFDHAVREMLMHLVKS